MLKKLLPILALVILVLVASGASFVAFQTRAFDASIAHVYEVPLPVVQRSTEPAVLARGEHLARSLGGCFACHGADLGGEGGEMGPVASVPRPNITSGKGGTGSTYSDAELARLIKHGLRRDGTSVRFMNSHEISWWPDEDVAALISYLRTVPSVDRASGVVEIKPLGKVLDRLDKVVLDVARRIDHVHLADAPAPAPAPTVQYGAYVGKLCTGCHGEQYSGGRIAGTPPEIPTPLNLTPDATGLKEWSYADFEKLMKEGIRKNGNKVNPFMPIDVTRNYNETELKGLWAYLQSLPPVAFGHR